MLHVSCMLRTAHAQVCLTTSCRALGGYGGPPAATPMYAREAPPPGPAGPMVKEPKASSAAAASVPRRKQDFPPEPRIMQEVIMLRRWVGKIIGPGGETANSIRRAANVQLHVRQERGAGDTQVVELTGTPGQVGLPAGVWPCAGFLLVPLM